jgi:hypothetical protein
MTTTPDVAPDAVLFEVLHRPGRKHRWRRIGRAATRAEALTFVRGDGDFRVVELRADASPAASASAPNDAKNGECGRRGPMTAPGAILARKNTVADLRIIHKRIDRDAATDRAEGVRRSEDDNGPSHNQKPETVTQDATRCRMRPTGAVR